MKGIVLAGGSGTRLYPLTRSVSKQLMPIYDKPMIYYPLSTLLLAGLREILIITTPEDQHSFRKLLGDGTSLGIRLDYRVQPRPEGIAQAFLIAESFLKGDSAALVLGDNIFYGHGLPELLEEAVKKNHGSTIFAYQVKDPERYGVVSFDKHGKALTLEEKPKEPQSSYAVTGLYIYDSHVVEMTKSLKPSKRGELEITDLNRAYLKKKALKVEMMGRGIAWLDTGTHESLMQASNFIQAIENRQGLKVACLEEIAFRKGYITAEAVRHLAEPMKKNEYGQYLLSLLAK